MIGRLTWQQDHMMKFEMCVFVELCCFGKSSLEFWLFLGTCDCSCVYMCLDFGYSLVC